MYSRDPRKWKCGNCEKIVADELQRFVYETYCGSMPGAIEFYCPHCKAVLEIYLTWQLPTIRSVKIRQGRDSRSTYGLDEALLELIND